MTRETDNRRPLAVFDIDNTLADTDHRQHCLERRPGTGRVSSGRPRPIRRSRAGGAGGGERGGL